MAINFEYSAARAALFTPELLEMILLYLDMKTLLLSRGVSKDWANIMASSLPIQQTLFFQPVKGVPSIVPLDPTNNHFGDHSSKIIYNPLLIAKFGSAFFKRDNEGYYTRICLPARYFYRLPWSPRNAPYADIVDSWGKEVWDEEEWGPEVVENEKAIRRRFTQSGASWRQMLVSQPPPPLLGYCWADLDSSWQTVSTAMVEPSPGGLRMGELYDMVQYHSGLREHNSMQWFPVTGRGLGLRFVFDVHGDTQKGKLNETNFAVEFQHVTDSGMYERDSSEVDAFDAEFRCDDFSYVNASTETVLEKGN